MSEGPTCPHTPRHAARSGKAVITGPAIPSPSPGRRVGASLPTHHRKNRPTPTPAAPQGAAATPSGGGAENGALLSQRPGATATEPNKYQRTLATLASFLVNLFSPVETKENRRTLCSSYGIRDSPSESRFRVVQPYDDPTKDCGSGSDTE